MAEDPAEDLRPAVANRRSPPRLQIRGIARVRVQRREMHAETDDISAHGVCLTLPRALEVGSTCRLDLEILGPQKRSTSVEARVCFCLQSQSGYRIGLNCPLEEFIADDA